MVYRIIETDDEPKEYFETIRRRMVAYSHITRGALEMVNAPVEVCDLVERHFYQLSMLIAEIIENNDEFISDRSISLLEFAVDMIHGTAWVAETAIHHFKAHRGYKLKGSVFRTYISGFETVVDKLKKQKEGFDI